MSTALHPGRAPTARSTSALSVRTAQPYGVYVHVPFCRMLCTFCDFVKVKGMEGWYDRYVAAVLKEAASLAERQHPAPARSLYFGGGTPSALGGARLARLGVGLARCFGLESNAEVCLEANPEDVDADFAAALPAAGFTRVSLGVQTFDDARLRRLGRRHSGADADVAARRLLSGGALSVNADLMYGLPGQSLSEWQHDLERALALGVHHLSCYALTLEPATPLGRQVDRGRVSVPSDDVAADMYAHACERLASAGYLHYEVSNWARPGHQSRHNQLYWEGANYVGLGAGAVGCLDGRRWWNQRQVMAYCQQVEKQGAAVEQVETLSLGDRARERLLLALRTSAGLDLAAFASETRIDLRIQRGPFWREAAQRGMLQRRGGRLRVPEERWSVLHSIVAGLLADLDLQG